MKLEIVKMSFESLLSNKTRSFLSMLGIIIGVATIFAIFTIGQGAQNAVDEQFEGFSVNSVMVFGNRGKGSTGSSKLTTEDAKYVADRSDNIIIASGIINGGAGVKYGTEEGNYEISGVDENYIEGTNFELESGRIISSADVKNRERVAVVGSTIVEDLFEEGEEVLGESIVISGKKIEIIGTLKEKGAGMNSSDNKIITPYTTAQQSILGNKAATVLFFEATSVDNIEAAKEDIIALLREKHGLKSSQEDDFKVFDAGSMIEGAQDAAKMMSLFLMSIAAIALLVSGIGIMNVMFATVSERTKEIGIAKAIGGKRKDILGQFVLESVVLSMMGGIIGVLVGNGIVYIVNKTPLAEFIQLAPSLKGMIIGVGFSVLVGVFFGFYPALKASRLDPVDALRSE